MQLNSEHSGTYLLPMRQLTESGGLVYSKGYKPQSPPRNPPLTQVQACQNANKPKSRGPYTRYTAHQVEMSFYLVWIRPLRQLRLWLASTFGQPNTTSKYNDMRKGAYRSMWAKWRLERKQSWRKHSRFLLEFIDEHPSAVRDEIRRALFSGFQHWQYLHPSAQPFSAKCRITLKRLQKLPAARNEIWSNAKAPKEKVEGWDCNQAWISPEIVYSLMRQVSTYRHKEITAAFEMVLQQADHTNCKRNHNRDFGCHLWSRCHFFLKQSSNLATEYL